MYWPGLLDHEFHHDDDDEVSQDFQDRMDRLHRNPVNQEPLPQSSEQTLEELEARRERRGSMIRFNDDPVSKVYQPVGRDSLVDQVESGESEDSDYGVY